MKSNPDEILDEIRRYREEHAASFDYDVDRIVDDIQRRQRESSRKVVALSPKRPTIVQGVHPKG